jgi:hypothetical protein
MKVLDSLVEAAVNRGIPIMLLQNVSDELCTTLELKSLSCFCLLKRVLDTSTDASFSNSNAMENRNGEVKGVSDSVEDDIYLSAKLDALKEMILIHAKTA